MISLTLPFIYVYSEQVLHMATSPVFHVHELWPPRRGPSCKVSWRIVFDKVSCRVTWQEKTSIRGLISNWRFLVSSECGNLASYKGIGFMFFVRDLEHPPQAFAWSVLSISRMCYNSNNKKDVVLCFSSVTLSCELWLKSTLLAYSYTVINKGLLLWSSLLLSFFLHYLLYSFSISFLSFSPFPFISFSFLNLFVICIFSHSTWKGGKRQK